MQFICVWGNKRAVRWAGCDRVRGDRRQQTMRSHVETAKGNGVEAHAYLTPVRRGFLRQHRRAVRSTVALEYRHDYSTCLTPAIASFLYSDLSGTTGSASHRKHLD